ncbi:MAG: DNA polymerase III subunit beta [bacterium]|nr:DNA polymerase III subunit beta [bacterium]
MRFSCTQENLKNALNRIGGIAARQGTLPILSNVRIRATGNTLTFSATNLELAMVAHVRGKVDEDGEAAVNAKLLTDVVQLFPSDRIDVVMAKGVELELACRENKTKVRGMDASEFPLIPEVDRGQEVVVSTAVLRDAFSRITVAMASGTARPELCGALAAFTDGGMRLAATDSYRLAEVTMPFVRSTAGRGAQIIMPGRTVQEILRVLGTLSGGEEDVAEVTLAFTPNQLVVTAGSLTLTSRLVDGTYPDYQQIIPQSFQTRVVLPRGELQKTVRAASLFARTGVNDVHLRVAPKDGVVRVWSENAQLGEHQAAIEVSEGTGDEVTTVLNARYLLDGLSAIPSDEVAIELTGAVAPVTLRPPEVTGQLRYLYIIMPIKQ